MKIWIVDMTWLTGSYPMQACYSGSALESSLDSARLDVPSTRSLLSHPNSCPKVQYQYRCIYSTSMLGSFVSLVAHIVSPPPSNAKPFPCHTYEKRACKSFACHTYKNKGLKVLCLPHLRKNPGGWSAFRPFSLNLLDFTLQQPFDITTSPAENRAELRLAEMPVPLRCRMQLPISPRPASRQSNWQTNS